MYRPLIRVYIWLIRVHNTFFFIHRGTGKKVGTLMSDYCQESINVTQDAGNYSASWFRNQTSMRADLWWLCGNMNLKPTLPPNWQGSCTMALLLMPFHLFPVGDFKALGEKLSPEKLRRLKRSTVTGGSFDNRVYLDSMRVPKGVPDEFKARYQVASFLF